MITWPITILEGQVEYISLVTGLPLEEARAFANKLLSLPDLRPATPAFLLTKRDTALAAKAARGTGPRSSASWRGNERTTKYRNQ